jgi:hypothetical protein
MSLSLNYDLNAYVAVILSPSSPFFQQPAALAQVHPAVAYVAQVGDMEDVQLYSVAKFEWEKVAEDVLNKVGKSEGVVSVDVQKPAQRARRGNDEL